MRKTENGKREADSRKRPPTSPYPNTPRLAFRASRLPFLAFRFPFLVFPLSGAEG
jgi:hypothetical protein